MFQIKFGKSTMREIKSSYPSDCGYSMCIGSKLSTAQHRKMEFGVADVCWFVCCFSIFCENIEFLALFRFPVIAAFVGLVFLLKRLEIKAVLYMLSVLVCINSLIVLSVCVGDEPAIIINFVMKAYIISPFVYLYLTHRGLRSYTLLALSSGVVPQLIAYLTANSFGDLPIFSKVIGQFVGTVGDPNFCCLALVVALGAQLALVRCSRSLLIRLLGISAAGITMFIISITISRTGMLAMILAIAIFGLSMSYRYPYIAVLTGFFLLYGLVMTAYLADDFYSDAAIGKLYRRFIEEGNNSMLWNDRYIVWGNAFREIIYINPPLGYNSDNSFIVTQGTAVHSLFLHFALLFGWLPAIGHLVIWWKGIMKVSWSFFRELFIRSRKNLPILATVSAETLIIIPFLFISLSLPCAGGYLYWLETGIAFYIAFSKSSLLHAKS